VGTVDEVAIKEADVQVDWDDVQVSPRVHALDSEQARTIDGKSQAWNSTLFEQLCGICC
jgi:hypothetical protein